MAEDIEKFYEKNGKTNSSYNNYYLSKKSEINPKLKEYIEENVFPEYSKNGKSHDLTHIK